MFKILSEIEDIGMEEQKVEEYVPSWEDEFKDEFGEELMDFTMTDEGEFDPVGDLKLLEDLLYNEPSVGIKKEPCEESHEVVGDSVFPPLHFDCEKPKHEPYTISIRDMSRFKKLAKRVRRRIFGLKDHGLMTSLNSPPHFTDSFSGEFNNWWFKLNSDFHDHMSFVVGFFPTNCKRKC